MENFNKELENLAKSIIEDAKNNLQPNKETGSLAKSLSYTIKNNSISIYQNDYGMFLNSGTKKIKATHYMDKAIDENLDKIDDVVIIITNDIIKIIDNGN